MALNEFCDRLSGGNIASISGLGEKSDIANFDSESSSVWKGLGGAISSALSSSNLKEFVDGPSAPRNDGFGDSECKDQHVFPITGQIVGATSSEMNVPSGSGHEASSSRRQLGPMFSGQDSTRIVGSHNMTPVQSMPPKSADVRPPVSTEKGPPLSDLRPISAHKQLNDRNVTDQDSALVGRADSSHISKKATPPPSLGGSTSRQDSPSEDSGPGVVNKVNLLIEVYLKL